MDRLGVMYRLYFDPRQSGSFGGLSAAKRYLIEDAKSWLIRQVAYTLRKPITRRFRRRQTFTKGIHDLSQTDLVDMQSLSNHNDGVKFYLFVSTCFQGLLGFVKTSLVTVSQKHLSQF